MQRGCALVAGWLVVLASVPGLGTKPAPALADDPGIQWTSSWGREVSYVEPEPHRAFLLPQFPWTSALEYDGAGRVTQVGDLTLGYDQVTDELISAGLPGGNTWEYRYDPHGRRLRTVTTTVSGNKTTTTTHLFAHDPLLGDLLRRQAGNKADTYLPLDLGRTDGQNAYAINHYDTVGSLRAVTGVHRNNTVTKSHYDYAAYGALAPASDPDPAQDFGFGGHPQGPAGLWLMGGRPYHPALGRFLTPDPAGAGHVYANNSPMLYADPSGDIPCLGSWDAVRRCVAVVNPVADMVALVAGGITAGAALTGIGAPIAAVTGPIAIGAGAIATAGRMALAADTCVNTKGSCLSAVAATSVELALYRVRLSSGANRLPAPQTAARVADDVPSFTRSQYGRLPPAQRAAALERAPTCPYCGTRPSSQVDHITALRQDWSAGGWADDFATRTVRVNNPSNLIGACASCNAAKGARALGEGPGQWWPPGWPSGTWWPFGP